MRDIASHMTNEDDAPPNYSYIIYNTYILGIMTNIRSTEQKSR
jgi:hypothetical protein